MAEDSAPTKRAYKRLEFSEEAELQLINYVKQHPELYNPSNKLYKDRDALWNELGEMLQKTGPSKHSTPSRVRK